MRLLALVALGVAVVLAGGATRAVSATAKKPEAVPGQLIVGFAEGVSQGQQNAAIAQAGAKKKKGFKQIGASLVEVPVDETAAVTKALSSDPRVRYVEPNHVVSLLTTPNDPSYGQLWGLNNTGQTGGTPDADIDAPEAWDSQTGSASVVVAVSDTGVDFSHPDLAAQQWLNPLDPENGSDDDLNGLVDDFRGWDFVSDDNNPTDDNDHGTHVSGTIGAAGNNAVGVVGVNWNVKIMALKFLDSTGNGTTADAIDATIYAAEHGADISSNSWGGGPFDQALLEAIEYGASQGMLFVAAAGNDGANNDTTPTYPANYASPAIVSVAATDHNDLIAFFSNYGAKTVDLGAPGVNVLSTTRGNTYQSFSGTSMATPHVSGVAALAKAHFPSATPYALKALLLGSVDPNASLTGKTRTNGRLNAANAVSCENVPEVVLEAPAAGFKASVGEVLEISVIGANCAAPAGLGNVSVTVNGAPISLSASGSPDSGLYTGSYVPSAEESLTVNAQVTSGAATDTDTVAGTAAVNYSCVDINDPWVDVTPGTRLTTASNSDDGFSTLNITFPFSFYGQTYTTAYVSSNGFLTLGSSAGADAFANVSIPNAAAPNGQVAAWWDDLDPSTSGDVYAGLTGSVGSRVLHVEWFNVPHFALFGGSGLATFEMSLYEANGEIRLRYLDSDLGNASWNAGNSATAGMEKVDGSFAKEVSFNQPALTSGREISCTFGAPPPPPAPTITTTSLADGTTTQPYSQTLVATGGTPPYTWSVSAGSLPPGLTLDPASGAITGTPAATGTFSFTARVADSLSQADTQALAIAVADPLAITTTSLPGGTVGQPYTQTVQATGGATPYAWSVVSGSLPPGLNLNGGTGEIAGTPTSAGTYPFTVQASDAANPARTDAQVLSIAVVGDPPSITTTSLADGTTSQPYSQTLAATGGSGGYTWSVATGSLPPGLALDPATGAITGTPTTVGNYAFTAQVTDSLSQSDTQALSIAVADPLAVTTTSLPGGTVGQSYSQTLAAMGGAAPYAWSVVTGSLPPGLSLASGTGAITGTPTTAGTYPFTVQASDAGNPARTDTQALSVDVVGNPPTITTTSLTDGTTGQPYSQTLAATGGTPPYTWSLDSGSLPPGLSLNPSSGAITGTPTAAGSYPFTARATDSLSQFGTQALSITVADPVTITTTSLPGGTAGQPYSQTLAATGGAAPYAWSVVTGSLPPGLTLNVGTGQISGTPTTAGTYPFTVQVSDAGNPARTDAQALSITVSGPTQVTASPDTTTVLTGTFRSGTASDLAADDNAYYEVNSTTSGKKTSAWYGSFTGVTNSLSNLNVSYTGKNSRSCTQTVAIWRWTTSSWIQLDSRTVGTTEVAIANLVPGGTLADYVSGTSGDGEVRVRVRCRTSAGTFFSSGDLMSITYVRP